MPEVPLTPGTSNIYCIEHHLGDLRGKKLIFFCNTAWPQYSLGDEEKWPNNGTLNFNMIYQLDFFSRKTGQMDRYTLCPDLRVSVSGPQPNRFMQNAFGH